MAEGPRLYSPYDEPMWQSASEGALKLQRCAGCGRFRYPPGPCCPACLSTEATWEAVSGRGRVLSWTTFHRQYLPAYPAPTTCVAVELEEGPIFIANVDAVDAAALRVDAPVELIYGTHPDGYALPRFRLAVEAAR
ncbi:MAG TPA: OB-fold domain-containing protein [Hyphomicrobiales bacterium]|nr:OB-fold domain-containing protein [Hyphomicrobiales bacterium]